MKTVAVTSSLIVAVLFFIAPVALAQSSTTSADQAKQLELQYKGKLLRVRYLVSDSKIRYDKAGNLTGKWHAGRWTWHSDVEVTNIELKNGVLKIKANRLLLNYNRGVHLFTPVRSGTVEIDIETSTDADGNIDLNREWYKAFLKPTEEHPLEMQPYWKPFISCIIKPDTDECRFYEQKSREPDVLDVKSPPPTWQPSYGDAYTVGRGVTPPKVRSRVEPEYTPIARAARVQGTVLLEAMVSKTGGVEIKRLIRPLGYGLEENAAEALSQWTFEPATRNGQPVNVVLYIEVNFMLR